MKSILLILMAFYLPIVAFAADSPVVTTTNKKQKNYPGGQDEEELKVQESLAAPTLNVDRKSIEDRVLKSYLKKADTSTETTQEN